MTESVKVITTKVKLPRSRPDHLNAGDIVNGLLSGQEAIYQRAATSPFYYYTLDSVDWGEGEALAIDHTYNAFFYSHRSAAVGDFARAQEALLDGGRSLARRDPDPEEIGKAGGTLWVNTALLVSSLGQYYQAPAAPIRGSNRLSHLQQRQLKQACDRIGTTKPDGALETLRRYAPRFTWHLHRLPVDLASGTQSDQQRTDQHITVVSGREVNQPNYTFCDACFLVEPTWTPADGLPMHLVFDLARRADEAGNADLGYRLRTRVIAATLEMEANRASLEQAAEIPFFSMILAGQLTGAVNQRPSEPFFDLPAQISKTMVETYERFIAEEAAGQPGPARDFLTALLHHYPQLFPALIARSALACAEEGSFDCLRVLRVLSRSDIGLAKEILPQAQAVADRRIITEAEAQEITEKITITEQSGRSIEEEVAALTENLDIYVFSLSPAKVGVYLPGQKMELVVEIDTRAEMILANLIMETRNSRLHLPFEVGFDPEGLTVRAETVSGLLQNDDVLEVLHEIVARAVGFEADKKRRLTAQAEKRTAPTQTRQPAEPRQGLTREERIAEYLRIKTAGQPKRRATGDYNESCTTSKEPVNIEAEAGKVALHIVGIEPEIIEEMLAESGVGNLMTARTFLDRLRRNQRQAEVSQRMLGKKITLGGKGSRAAGINLRQLNWVLGGGTHAVRVYLEDTGGGTFKLRGVLYKKSETEQQRYIDRLADRILAEREEPGEV